MVNKYAEKMAIPLAIDLGWSQQFIRAIIISPWWGNSRWVNKRESIGYSH